MEGEISKVVRRELEAEAKVESLSLEQTLRDYAHYMIAKAELLLDLD